MNPAALSALFAQHRTAVLGGGAAAVVGLALLNKKKKAAATNTGTIPVTGANGSVSYATPTDTPTYGNTPGTSSADIYNLLNDQLQAAIRQQTTPIPVAAQPATSGPLAATMYAPSASKRFVRFSNGQIDQVQSDGSLLWLTGSEASSLFGKGGWKGKVDQLPTAPPAHVYSTAGNLAAASSKFGLPATPATPVTSNA